MVVLAIARVTSGLLKITGPICSNPRRWLNTRQGSVMNIVETSKAEQVKLGEDRPEKARKAK